VLQECLSLLKRLGIMANRLNNGSFCTNSGYHCYGIPGAGDIIGILPGGRHLEVECKAGKGGSLSDKQQERMRNVRRAGGVYIVAHSAGELSEQLQPIVLERVSNDTVEGNSGERGFEGS
jgi:hypothetical protein